ncbi:MAG: hypothetical protein LZF86_10087 [Nitrospira sp.]|nr:MAG: hypothetical protein LZF86_10087 [Nitrospira sp.]
MDAALDGASPNGRESWRLNQDLAKWELT